MLVFVLTEVKAWFLRNMKGGEEVRSQPGGGYEGIAHGPGEFEGCTMQGVCVCMCVCVVCLR